MPKRKTTEQFIAESKEVHGDKYDYSKVEYVNNSTKIIIICPEHEPFDQRPSNHLKGHGCRKCFNERQAKTAEEFKAKARAVHGNKYDYSKVEYVNSRTKITIICPEHGHGEFEQRPNDHLLQGQGCPDCGIKARKEKATKTTEQFKAEAKKVHDDKYDYSKVVYKHSNKKITIICPEHGHGEFEQTPVGHLQGNGCPQCAIEGKRKTAEEFKAKARAVHGNKYDYSKVVYNNAKTDIIITCLEHGHGDFEQTPGHHLEGRGCPECAESLVSEPIFRKVLQEITSLKFPKKKPKWLRNPNTNYPLELDCYNEKSKIAFELQGVHHYRPVAFWGGEEAFQKTLERDQIKKTTCEEKGIHLFCIDQRPATGKTPQEKEDYYKKEIKKCLQQLPQHVKIKMNRR